MVEQLDGQCSNCANTSECRGLVPVLWNQRGDECDRRGCELTSSKRMKNLYRRLPYCEYQKVNCPTLSRAVNNCDQCKEVGSCLSSTFTCLAFPWRSEFVILAPQGPRSYHFSPPQLDAQLMYPQARQQRTVPLNDRAFHSIYSLVSAPDLSRCPRSVLVVGLLANHERLEYHPVPKCQ